MTEFVQKAVQKIAIATAVFFCAFSTSFIFANYVAMAKFGRDFSVYWRAANQPLSEVYFWQGAFPFPYAPTMLLWVKPLALVQVWLAYFLFISVSIAAFVWVCRPYLSKGAMGLALISPPFARGIFTGQVCAILAAVVIWACGTRSRAWAGIAFGIAASIKPQVVLMAPLMFVLNRDWKAFHAAWASFLAILIAAFALFGVDRWPEWLASMDHFHSAVADTSIINIAVNPAAIAERFGYPPLPFMLAGTVLGAIIVYLCRDTEPVEKAAAITMGSLMAAPYALAYDLTAAMPFLALCVFRGRMVAAFGIGYPLYPWPAVAAIFELMGGKFVRRIYAERAG